MREVRDSALSPGISEVAAKLRLWRMCRKSRLNGSLKVPENLHEAYLRGGKERCLDVLENMSIIHSPLYSLHLLLGLNFKRDVKVIVYWIHSFCLD